MRKVILTSEQKKYLKRNYGKKTLDEIGRKLNISAPTVKFKAVEMGLSVEDMTKKHSVWNDEQIGFLIENYPTTTLSDLSDKIGFSMPTIRKKAMELGLKRADDYDIRKFSGRFTRNYKHHQIREGEQ